MYRIEAQGRIKFEWCAALNADDGDGKIVTILKRSVTHGRICLDPFSDSHSANKFAQPNEPEFGKYTDVEILKGICVHIVNCGMEKDMMNVMDSYKFLDDKTEIAGVVAEPTVSGSLRRMRACEKEYDVCPSLSRSISAESQFNTRVKWIAENENALITRTCEI